MFTFSRWNGSWVLKYNPQLLFLILLPLIPISAKENEEISPAYVAKIPKSYVPNVLVSTTSVSESLILPTISASEGLVLPHRFLEKKSCMYFCIEISYSYDILLC